MPKKTSAYDGRAKNQHYVPQCLLEGFATGESTGKFPQIWVYDKQSHREPYATAIRNVAAETGFYNLKKPTGVASFDPLLGRLEDAFAPIMQRIRAESSIASLSEQERLVLAMFACVQMQRTKSFQLKIHDFAHQLADRIRKMAAGFGVPEWAMDEHVEGAKKPTEAESKALALRMMLEAPSFTPLLLQKTLILLRAPAEQHYLVSDNPIALHNMKDHGWRGNLGLGVEGIEVYLPISKELVLWWICPSYEQQFRTNRQMADALLPRLAEPQRTEVRELLRANKEFLDAIDNDTPIEATADNVLAVNSLQVKFSERFVFASRNDFALVSDMLEKYPKLKQGPRMVVE